MTVEPNHRCPDCDADLNGDAAFCSACGKPLRAVSIALDASEPASRPAPRRRGRLLLLAIAAAAIAAVIASTLRGGDTDEPESTPTTVPFIGEDPLETSTPSIIGAAEEDLLLRAGDGLYAIDLRTGRQRTVVRGYVTGVDRIDLSSFAFAAMSTEGRFVWGVDIGNNVGLATILEAGRVVGSRDGGNAWMLQDQGTSTRAVLTILNAWNAIAQLEIPNSATIVGAVGTDLVVSSPSGTMRVGSGTTSLLSHDRAFAVADPFIAYESCTLGLVCSVVVRAVDDTEIERWPITASNASALAVDRAWLSPDGRHVLLGGTDGLELLSSRVAIADLSVEMTDAVWTSDGQWVAGRGQDDHLIFLNPLTGESRELDLRDFVSAEDLPLVDGRIHAFMESTGLFEPA